MIQQKVENLKISLEHFCNIKGDISEVLRVAEEQLKMRNQCRIINQQASLWELKDIVKRENKRDVILNYRNLLLQRIILNLSDMSTLFVSNSLMGTKIEKAFPNLKATVAFSFLFKAEENQRLSDLRSLQKKTMETSLLLGNLIDVLEEIEDAKGELLSLISADFSVDSQTVTTKSVPCQAGQLIFSLRFIGYESAKRVAFTIDMTDLSRAVYPSEPSELPIKVWQAQTTLSQPNLDKLMASIRDDLQPGRVMILRLCRMVSQLVNTLPVRPPSASCAGDLII
uniref:Knl1 C-terminal RWD domain-containing protein n=1 Tax=Aegilops tauschii TaxID=37682 RepID=N1QZL7_AEGTA